ncbi:MAG: hypothetical protein Q4F67_11090 [Propionibacteriaceae bacterium]|nr:hypothetical protein [Propionibacteriaceae bacterium]
MTRLTMRIAAGIGAIALAGSMTACANTASTAATVGGERITVTELNQLMEGLPETLEAHPSVVLNIKMRGLAAEQVAEERGLSDLRARAEEQLARGGVPAELMADPEVRTLLMAEANTMALEQEIGTGEVNQAFGRIPVTTNPRYGLVGLDQVQQLRNTSLSKPASAPQ